jgi:hypothetical protein
MLCERGALSVILIIKVQAVARVLILLLMDRIEMKFQLHALFPLAWLCWPNYGVIS